MARQGPLTLGLALTVLLLAATVDQASTDDKCRTGCKGITPRDFKYAEGTTYKYTYEGNVDVLLSSAEGQQSTTKVRATVLLTQQPQCEQVIRIENLHVIGSDGKKYNIPNIEKPIRINFHDGHVEDVICADPTDTQYSLNIKRAIASAFQVNYKHAAETDVFGLCPTVYSTYKDGGALVVKKSRNLNKCSFRETVRQDFIATAFDLKSEIKASPFLQGDYVSEQKIKNGILEQTTITENYLYVPFSVGNNGAKAQVQSKLVLTGSSADNANPQVSTPRSIIFDNPHQLKSEKSNVNTVLKAIKEVATTIGDTVDETTANKFYNLIRVLKAAGKNDLLTVYNQVRAGAGFADKNAAKKIFLDALFRAGTGDTIEVAIELYKKQELNPIETKLLFLGLTFVKHTTPNSLKAALDLLNTPDIPNEAYLGIGILAHRFITSHPALADSAEVDALLNGYLTKISTKVTDRSVENTVIATLKAISNTRKVNDGLAAKIIELAQDKSAPIRVRVAALETYLSDPDNDKFRESALNILKDIQQDSEIRIKAYLAVAKHPNGKVAAAIKTLLAEEPSFQVGGFIASHLRAIRTSVSPDDALAKAQLGQIVITRNFPFDPRKYSFHLGESDAFDTLGLSGSVQGDVIYSQRSFLPRSTSLNLTAQVFGHTFNFLEVNLRQENLDKVLEHYVGPLGVLRKESPQTLVDKSKEGVKKLIDRVNERAKAHKVKRDVPKAQIDYIGKQITDKQNELDSDLDLDLHLKLFGSEALFLSINENAQKYSPEVIIDKIFDAIDKGIDKAKDFDEIIRSNLLFLDVEIAYPTSLGLPLRLQLEGTSNVQVKAKGNIDLHGLHDNKQEANWKLSLIPSGSVEVAARFLVDAGLVESGLKIVGNLYTATGGALEVTFGGKKTLDVKYSLPVEKQQLVTATHTLVFETRELDGTEQNIPIKFTQNKDFAVCLDQLNSVLGLTFCAEINQPNLAADRGVVLPFPLNGNSKFSVTIEKNDISYYHLQRNLYENDRLGVEIIAEAVDKQKKPKITLKVEAFTKPDIYFRTSLDSALKTASLEARILNTGSEKAALLKFIHDNIEYYGKIGATVSGTSDKAIYKPLIEYKLGTEEVKRPPYNIEGQIIVETNGPATKYIFDNVKLIGPEQKPITLSGSVGREPGALSTDLTLTSGNNHGTLKGRVQHQDSPDLAQFKANVELQTTINPQANFNLKYEFKKVEKQTDSNLQFIHGKDLASKENILKLTNSFKDKSESEDKPAFVTKNHISYPALGLDGKLDIDVTPKSVEYEAKLAYKKIKIGSELEIKFKEPESYELEFELHGLDTKIEVDSKREVHGDKSKIAHKITVNGKSLEVTGTVTHKIHSNDGDLGSDLTVKITNRPDIKFLNKLSYSNSDVDLVLKITYGGDVLIDAFLKADEGENANGNLKLNIKDIITGSGQIKANKGAGNGYILIEIPKLERKIKLESGFTIKDPTYNVEVTLYSNFEKDNSKKYVISTANQVQSNSFDSKNFVEILGKKITGNLKVGYSGDISDGKQSVEYEIILPNEQYFAGKFNRELHVIKDVANGDIYVALEHRDNKNTPGRKLTYKGTLKNVDLDKGTYDIFYNVAADNSNGKTLNGDLALKSKKVGNKIITDWGGKIYGSLLPETLEANLNSEIKDTVGDYKVTTKYGKSASLDVNGKFNVQPPEKKTPSTGEINIEIKTPFAKIATIKFNGGGSILLSVEKDDTFELKGSSAFFVDDNGTEEGALVDLKGEADIKGTAENARSKISVSSKGVKYVLEESLVLSDRTPSISWQLTHPDGKVDKLVGKIAKISPKSFAGELKIANGALDFTFDGSLDVSAENIDDFSLKLTADSPALKINKFVLQANTKEAKASKKIQFSVKAADQNILSGGASYKTREEGGKFVIEGSGNFKLKEDSKSGNFKFIRQNLELEKNKEQGIEVTFEAALGHKAIDAEFKATNKQFRISNSYCEEKKQCAHVEIDSKTSIADLNQYGNVLEVNVDLRKLGLSHEFGLKSVTTRKEFVLDHTVDVHFQSHENKYKYSLYVHPKEAGISLTTPKRVVSIEGELITPGSGKKESIGVKGFIYLNKKAEPDKRTGFSLTLENRKKDQTKGETITEFKLTHPTFNKDLSVRSVAKYEFSDKQTAAVITVIDLFAKEKITLSASSQVQAGKSKIGSKYEIDIDIQPLKYGLKIEEGVLIDVDARDLSYWATATSRFDGDKVASGVTLKANPESSAFTVKIHNTLIFDVQSKLKLSKESQIIDSEFNLIGTESRTTHLEVKDFNTLKFSLIRTGHPEKKLQLSSALIPGQIADFRLDLNKDGQKLEMIHAYVKLDDADFLKSDYGINREHLKEHLYIPIKSLAENIAKATGNAVSKAATDTKTYLAKTGEIAKQNAPDLKPIVDYYKSELKKIKGEIVADKNIQKLSESLSKIFDTLFDAASKILEALETALVRIKETAQAQCKKLTETFEKDILPKLKESYDKLAVEFAKIFEKVSETFFAALGEVTKFVDAHQEDLKKIVTSLSGIGQDLGRFIAKSYDQIKTIITTEFNKLIEEVKALPIYEEIKTAYEQLLQGLPVPEKVTETFKNLAGALKDLSGVEEIKNLIDVTTNYVEKKLKNEAADDIAEIEKIVKVAIIAVKKILAQIEAYDFEAISVKIPLATKLTGTLPKLAAARFSFVNRLLEGEVPNLQSILYSFSFNPRHHILPFRLYAFIAQGQHIFTFDGKHLTFPGKCNYLLARDAVNGNFTIAGTYTNGILTAITISDKSDIITIKKGGVALLNGAATEFPVKKPHIESFRTYEGIHVKASAGVEVICGPELLVCRVGVSGFYHGQLRGLLGNGNNEPYDDYTLPNGKIVTSESEFGNAYKLQANCPAVKTVDHAAHQHNEACTDLFTSDTTDFLLCYPFVSRNNFRQACDHGIAAGVPDTEKAIAVAYTAACRAKYLPIDLPPQFLSCNNGDQTVKVGESFSVKLPQKAADVIIAVDVVKTNEPIYKDLVGNLVQSLTQEFSAKGIKDVDYHYIAYGGENQKYPVHITTNGGKLTSKGKVPNLKFSEVPDSTVDPDTGIKAFDFLASYLQNLKYDVELAIGETVQAKAYEQAINYPFRANALKTIIAVTGAPCESGSLAWLEQLRAITLADSTVTINTVTPLKDRGFKVKDEKTTKSVIGFSGNGVVTFADAKKRPQGNPDLLKDLTYDEYCAKYTYMSGGNVFVSDNFLEANKGNKKLFSQVAAVNIVEALTSVEQGLDCTCEQEGAYSTRTNCNVAYRKKKASSGRKPLKG